MFHSLRTLKDTERKAKLLGGSFAETLGYVRMCEVWKCSDSGNSALVSFFGDARAIGASAATLWPSDRLTCTLVAMLQLSGRHHDCAPSDESRPLHLTASIPRENPELV